MTDSETRFSRHFCQECFQRSGPIAGAQNVEAAQESCHYCGQPCAFGPGKISVQIPGAVVCCRECGEDFQDYMKNHMGEFPSEEEFVRDLEAFMQRRITERKSE